MSIHFLNSGVLFSVARAAYERTKSAPSERTGSQNDALVAVLFSAATLEAFIMELALVAQWDAEMFESKPLRSVAAVLEEAEASRASIRLKFLLAKAVLGQDTFDKGGQPYQDFDTLFALRDAIIHLKPERVSDEPQRLCNVCATTFSGSSARRITETSAERRQDVKCARASTHATTRRTIMPDNGIQRSALRAAAEPVGVWPVHFAIHSWSFDTFDDGRDGPRDADWRPARGLRPDSLGRWGRPSLTAG